jgi:hypothetical protein
MQGRMLAHEEFGHKPTFGEVLGQFTHRQDDETIRQALSTLITTDLFGKTGYNGAVGRHLTSLTSNC